MGYQWKTWTSLAKSRIFLGEFRESLGHSLRKCPFTLSYPGKHIGLAVFTCTKSSVFVTYIKFCIYKYPTTATCGMLASLLRIFKGFLKAALVEIRLKLRCDGEMQSKCIISVKWVQRLVNNLWRNWNHHLENRCLPKCRAVTMGHLTQTRSFRVIRAWHDHLRLRLRIRAQCNW